MSQRWAICPEILCIANRRKRGAKMSEPIKITALTAEELATLLSRASRKAISGQDVLAIATTAGIVSAAGTINLIEYAAFLAKETSHGEN